jgi:hypothetical protein
MGFFVGNFVDGPDAGDAVLEALRAERDES